MLFNQTHDLMSGVMTEHVYEDVVRGYDFSKRIAQDEVEGRLRSVSAAIDTRGEGVPVAVFNMLGWPRTDLAIANVGFSDSKIMGVKVLGPDGANVPVQILDVDRGGDGGLLRVRIAFIARDVPAIGYSVYRVLPSIAAAEAVAEKPDVGPVLENADYRIEFDPAGGAILHLLVKKGNWDALRAPGNVVAREQDRGDLWEPYHTLDGGSRIAMKVRHPAPPPGKAVFSSDQSGTRTTISRGPVFSEFHVAHPFGKKGNFTTTVRLYNGLRRIDVNTRIVNDETFVRYRALFPTSIHDGQDVHGNSVRGDSPAGRHRISRSKLDRLRQRPKGHGPVEPRAARQQRGRRHDDALPAAEHANCQLRRRQRRLWRRLRCRPGVEHRVRVRLRPDSPCQRLAQRLASIATAWNSINRWWLGRCPCIAAVCPSDGDSWRSRRTISSFRR